MADIFVIKCYIYDRSLFMDRICADAKGTHQTQVAGTDVMPVNVCGNALSGNFFDLAEIGCSMTPPYAACKDCEIGWLEALSACAA